MNDSETSGSICAETVPPVLTLAQLVEVYKTDKVSTFHQLRYSTRKNQITLLRRLVASKGNVQLSAIKRRDLVEWHLDWSAGGKLSMAQGFIGALRTVVGFGASMLELEQCERIAMVLHRMKFPHAPARIVHLSAEQAAAICFQARENFGWPSLALAQAIQFECMFRQRDCIGEWVPENEPGESDVHRGDGFKWLRGIRWEEVDQNWILSHKTSKKQKNIQWNLAAAPMVMAELAVSVEAPVEELTRSMFPAKGPIVVNEITGWPWSENEYRRKWRKVADSLGIPKEVRNMDSRAGAITEATEAGADIEHVKHAATHSDISQTQRYSRGAADKIAGVQKKRNEHRFRRAG